MASTAFVGVVKDVCNAGISNFVDICRAIDYTATTDFLLDRLGVSAVVKDTAVNGPVFAEAKWCYFTLEALQAASTTGCNSQTPKP